MYVEKIQKENVVDFSNLELLSFIYFVDSFIC